MKTERVHDLFAPVADPLTPFFRPRGVALLGATERTGSVGRATLENLATFPGPVYPVNPLRAEVLGRKAYRRVAELPAGVDLAVIATPAATVPGLVRECGSAGIPAVLILSAGFREIGPEGKRLEEEARAAAREGGVRLIGPNCLGLMSPHSGLNATFAQCGAAPGHVAFLSQSGALCTSILDWSRSEGIGFSAFVSVGSMADVEWGALLDYFGRDPETRSIVMYLESIPDARAFLSAARAAALAKPVVVIKAGRTEAAAHAAASHTGALTGNDDVLEAAFRRVGVLRVDRISELFHLADLLEKQPLPNGGRLAILTNAGGPGVLAADAAAGEGILSLPQPSAALRAKLDAFLPPHWSHANPFDVIGDADAERYGRTLEGLLADTGYDGVLAILTPQGMTDPATVAARVAAIPRRVPVLASWMGGEGVRKGDGILSAAGIATFPFPEDAVRAFGALWRYRQDIDNLYETPALTEGGAGDAARSEAARVIAEARSAGRTLLSEFESKRVLGAYGVPVVPTELAATAEDAVATATRMGFPVALKLNSHTITHKSDVGGVRLGLKSPAEVREAFAAIDKAVTALAGAGAFRGVTVQRMAPAGGLELILGASVDPQFGPVILFGAGGTMVEIFRDRSLALPPLNASLARRLINRTRISRALDGWRGGPPVDRARLEQLLVRFSELVLEQPSIVEIDVNPLVAGGDSLLALDARIRLSAPGTAATRPAIRPYPAQYDSPWTARNGRATRIRPLRAEDEGPVAAFHGRLSGTTVAERYGRAYELRERAAHARLARLCHADYDTEIALACVAGDRITGIARLSRLPDRETAELSLLVEDEWQGQGLGSELARRLVAIAAKEGIRRVLASLRADNARMRRLLGRLGFRGLERDGAFVAELLLK